MTQAASLLITSADGKVYRVARGYLVDLWLDTDTITIASIKGTRTIPITPKERERIAVKLHEWDSEDDYAAA